MSNILNLDEDSSIISNETLIQDIRDVHAKCCINFSYFDNINFDMGSCFIRWGTMWQVVSCKKTSSGIGTGYFYSILGYPAGICTFITTRHVNMSSLASSYNIAYDLKQNVNFNFEFPLRNIMLGALLFKYRYASFERNMSKLSNSWFIHYDHRGLVSDIFSGLGSSTAYSVDTDSLMANGGTFSHVSDGFNTFYHFNHKPSVYKYKNLVPLLFSDKFDFRSSSPALLGGRYIFTGAQEELFSNFDRLLLIRQKYDSKYKPVPWVLTFGQLEGV